MLSLVCSTFALLNCMLGCSRIIIVLSFLELHKIVCHSYIYLLLSCARVGKVLSSLHVLLCDQYITRAAIIEVQCMYIANSMLLNMIHVCYSI